VKDLYLRKFSTYYYELKEVKDNPVWIPIGFEFIHYFPYIERPNFVRELKEKAAGIP